MEIKPYERDVFYYETDQMQIVHHSNYIKWMEEARLNFLRQIGLDYDEMERIGLLIPVLGVSCEYKMAFRYGDTFRIQLKLVDFKQVKFGVTYEIYNASTGALHATATSSHGFVDRQLRPVRLKRDYPDIYEKLEQFA